MKIRLLILFCIYYQISHSQNVIFFQGGEGTAQDNWGYVSSGANPEAQAEALSAPNIVNGSNSLVVGGLCGGGSCFAGGTGNGTTTNNTFDFNTVDITPWQGLPKTFSFHYGNRYPVCNGTGWDSGENLYFQATIDGVPQPEILLVAGAGNLNVDIQTTIYTMTLPPCVNTFSFKLRIAMNRRDEFLFLDNVQITSPSPSPLSAGPDQTLCHNQVATLNGTMSGYYSALTWSGGAGQFSSSGTLSTQYTPAASEAGTNVPLYLTATDTCGNQRRDTVVLNYTLPVPTGTISASLTSLCAGQSAVLSVPSGFTVLWNNNTTDTTLTVNTPGVYSVTLANNCGSVQDQITLTAATMPAISLDTISFNICAGQSQLVTATANAPVVWNGNSAGNSYTVNTPGTYVAVATNGCGSASDSITVGTINPANIQITTPAQSLCAGATLTLNATSNETINWIGGPTGNTYTINSPGTYIASAINYCGVVTDTVVITGLALPTAQIQSSATSLCPGITLTLTGSGTGVIDWNTGATTAAIQVNTPGTYIFSVTNACGTDTQSVQIQSLTLPTIQIQTAQTQICNGQNILLQAVSNSSILWSNGSSSPNVSISQAGIYSVSAANSCGTVSDSVTITAANSASVQISTPANIICPGQTMVVSAVATGNVSWNNGTTGNSITINAPGWYIASSTGDCGTETDSIYIGTSAPQASFTWTSNSPTTPAEISLINTSQNFSSSEWTMDEQSIGNSLDASVNINEPGTYLFGLTVTDLNGCTDDIKEYITLRGQEFVYIPNTFTPNEDELNEEFKIFIKGHKTVEISIYNRWGERLYMSADETTGWNGIYSGKKVPCGAYLYKVSGTWNSGSDFNYTGSLTVLSAQ